MTEIIKKIGNIIIDEYIKCDGFDTFKQMAKCYQYDNEDIKNEIISIMERDINLELDVDGNVLLNDEIISYKTIIQGVYKYLRENNIYD